jgi:hypothetical protein
MVLHNHHHHPFPELPHVAKLKLFTQETTASHSLALVTTVLLSSLQFPLLSVQHDWNPSAFAFF